MAIIPSRKGVRMKENKSVTAAPPPENANALRLVLAWTSETHA